MAAYLILRCTKCGALGIYGFGIASKCKACEKKFDLKHATVIRECASIKDAIYVRMELQRRVEHA